MFALLPTLRPALARYAAAGLLGLALIDPAAAASTFRGTWEGPWQEITMHQSGVFSFAVDESGVVTGHVSDGDANGLLVGTIDESGTLDAGFTFDGQTWIKTTGTLVRDNTHLRGTAHFVTEDAKPLGETAIDLHLKASDRDEQPDTRQIRVFPPLEKPRAPTQS